MDVNEHERLSNITLRHKLDTINFQNVIGYNYSHVMKNLIIVCV